MMINKRLLGLVPDSLKYIIANVIIQWISLVTNIVIMNKLVFLMLNGFDKTSFLIIILGLIIKTLCTILMNKCSYLSSKTVKQVVRETIYNKLLKLGPSYHQQVQTSEIIQLSVEGVEQLETYFGAYMPQFFYATLAPLTLFVYLCTINFLAAIVLLMCVPLIPVTIVIIQKWAKKLLSKYWGQYTSLGDTFLENLQGLTTLKIYQSDEFKAEQMRSEAEKFRVITMKVLTMQLNSITIMDFIAYGGAALGAIISINQLINGNISTYQALLIIILSADFFLPMRQLGSYFHVAMNGMAASDKIFALLDLEENQEKTKHINDNLDITISHLSYSYVPEVEVLHDINMHVKQNTLTSIVGESGCGKSTIAKILMGINQNYQGNITISGNELNQINIEDINKNITYVSFNSHLFKGSVKDNLLMANPNASDQQLWQALKEVKIDKFLESEDGLNTFINESTTNLSGGQRQRIVLARALLHDSTMYIFDEATSNIDIESEQDILEVILKLAKHKTVILITHRLANVVESEKIYVLDKGYLVEEGTHKELLNKKGLYHNLYTYQQELENFEKEVK